MSNSEIIHSFDSTCSINGIIARPENFKDLVQSCQTDFIPRGAGTSYVLASGGEGKTSVESRAFNRILNWDAANGVIEIECGANLGQLLNFLAKQKFWFSVLPGHPSITLGGAIAFNVHGKSQHHHGLFGDHLVGLTLYHPSLGFIECSPTMNEDLFDLTVGGIGLTGFIVSAKLRATPLKGNCIKRIRKKCANIFEAIETMEKYRNEHEYIYAWNDFNRYDTFFGKGWVYLENIIDDSSKANIYIPKHFNSLIYPTRESMFDRLLKCAFSNHIGTLYKLSEAAKGSTLNLPLFAGSFPIHGKEIYHRFFGKEGLLEYQLIVPWKELEPFLMNLKKLLKEARLKLSLGSLKIFKGKQSLLHFNGEGVCLSMDIPYSTAALTLFSQIDKLVLQHHCLPNIAKDSRLSSEIVKGCYSENYQEFEKRLNHWDPQRVVQSELRSRLCL